ncbi:MAG: hypothetical protein KC496_18285 [Anaerolineae bacterium]|nr:hypothetical protein [Anaerolineae bacterium]
MTEQPEFSTYQEVEALAAAQGVRFTKADRDKIQAAKDAERERLRHEQQAAQDESTLTWADRFMVWYPKLLESIASAGNIVMTFSQAVIANLGVPIVLIALLIVEQQRVLHGIELFETMPELAAFGAWALVISNLLLEIVAHHIEYTKNYEAQRRRRWSLRIWAHNMGYRLGLGKEWAEQELSPAQWAHSLLRLVTFAILALALAGSMKGVIQGIEGAWYSALVTIFTQSTLLEMMTWAGGLLFAAAAVLIAQGLSRYVAIRTVEIRAAMETTESGFDEELDIAAANTAYALLVEKLNKRREKSKPTSANPTHAAMQPPPVMAYNGNGNGNHNSNGNGNGSH